MTAKRKASSAKTKAQPPTTKRKAAAVKVSVAAATERFTMGIDEAGRGPAIGPLVMAAVVLDRRGAAALTRAGLTDSKAFGAGAKAHAIRQSLAAIVRERAIWSTVRVVDAATLDARVMRNELNVLEREVARNMIDAAPPCQRIIADGARMFAPMVGDFPHLEPRDRAESFHASVAAASVLAKTMRDELYATFCAQFAAEFGAIAGGGYVNDATRDFLRAYATKYRTLPVEVRLSWPHPYVEELVDLEALKRQRFGSAPASPQLTLF